MSYKQCEYADRTLRQLAATINENIPAWLWNNKQGKAWSSITKHLKETRHSLIIPTRHQMSSGAKRMSSTVISCHFIVPLELIASGQLLNQKQTNLWNPICLHAHQPRAVNALLIPPTITTPACVTTISSPEQNCI